MKKVENVLIIEDEVHLAQSISNALASLGYRCQSVSSIFHNFKEDYDVVLVSSKVCVDRCEHFVRKNSKAITIMMASFISEDSVNRPIQAGARDYILKPFKMDDLIRKITYHKSYQETLQRARVYDRYLDFMLTQRDFSAHLEHTPPFVVRSHTQSSADMFALYYARTHHLDLEFFSLKDTSPESMQGVFYATHLEMLRGSERDKCLKTLRNQQAIISFVGAGAVEFEHVITLESEEPLITPLELLSIQDYEKHAIVQFGPSYTDTELAKHLGISRKSLWEKRRRYNLPRKSNV
ncbi:response regulator [Helicobacter baculiformis]|uniref:Response regulator n=1 Tax=Helicobacter baculiformis TaxID=427351 RepID=A0ABV7ZLI4_9HELI|nr:response regulator [Helicobacter baculiformis]